MLPASTRQPLLIQHHVVRADGGRNTLLSALKLTAFALAVVGVMFQLGSSRTVTISSAYRKQDLSEVHEYISKHGSAAGAVLEVTLQLDTYTYRDGNVTFQTRAFNGQIPGPTIRVMPGDRLIVNLKNNLQDTANSPRAHTGTVLLSHSNKQRTVPFSAHPNSTNLHTHGWHVSPLLGSDNVLDVTVGPGESFQYIYDVPNDHMPGTFWYHTHLHGSTALQTGGGASGLLLIEARMNSTYPKWLQEITKSENEQLMMINHIPFGALSAISQYSNSDYTRLAEHTEANFATAATQAESANPLFQVAEETVAQLPSFWNTSRRKQNNHYQDSKRLHAKDAGSYPPGDANSITNIALVNGEYLPQMELTSGEWKLLKFLHAGPFFFMDITFEAEARAEVKSEDKGWSAAPQCEMQLLAKDGIYQQMIPRAEQRLILPPGGRADVAVRCIGAGKLRLVSGARPGLSGKWSSDLYWNPVMAVVRVVLPKVPRKDDDAAPPPYPYSMPRPAYLRNLVDAPTSDVTGTFDVAFEPHGVHAVTAAGKPMFPGSGDGSASCLLNGRVFDGKSPLGTMQVGTMQEWTMSSVVGHPLHLHVNPFQIVEVAGAAYSSAARSLCDLEFGYTCVGDWIDTLQLPTAVPGGKGDAKIRFMADRFVGHEVMHCHYLQHDDLGCMAFFEIAP